MNREQEKAMFAQAGNNGSGIYSGVIRDRYSKVLPSNLQEYKRHSLISIMKQKHGLGKNQTREEEKEGEAIRIANEKEKNRRRVIAENLRREAGNIESGKPVEVTVNVDTGAIPKIITDEERKQREKMNEKKKDSEKKVIEKIQPDEPKDVLKILPSASGIKPQQEPLIIRGEPEQSVIVAESPKTEEHYDNATHYNRNGSDQPKAQEELIKSGKSMKNIDDDFEGRLQLATLGLDVGGD